MRWIFISPHLDDAVLSVGGLIHDLVRDGTEVEIWTCMCGFPPDAELSPFAQLLHFQWGIPAAADVVSARRAEDDRAAARVGAKTHRFDFLDCIYRRGPNGEWLYTDIFVPPLEAEADLPGRVADAIAARLRPDDRVVCQLGLGGHVDHVLVRQAVELLGRPLIYDVDIPYLFNRSEQLDPLTANLQPWDQPVSEAGLAAWQEGIACYESQISSLFDGLDGMREQVRAYWERNSGLRLWTV